MSAEESDLLERLGQQFLAALRDQDRGRIDDAEDKLRAILREEPRLAEPHLALGRILLDTDRLDDAETHSREALEYLKSDGQWTDDLPEQTLLSMAHAQLAEVLRRRADEDDVIFGDPETFHALVKESQSHFALAAELDPSDDTASFHAFFLGPEGHQKATN